MELDDTNRSRAYSESFEESETRIMVNLSCAVVRVLERAEGAKESSETEGARRKRKRKSERKQREARRGRERLKRDKKAIQFPVIIARGIHLFPYRTQKLSL